MLLFFFEDFGITEKSDNKQMLSRISKLIKSIREKSTAKIFMPNFFGSPENNDGNLYPNNSKKLEEDSLDKRFTELIKGNKADSILRKIVDQEDKYNFDQNSALNTKLFLSSPAKGPISQGFDIKEEHFAVDIVLEENTPIKSIADGTVIFSEWTAQTGYVIIIRHNYGFMSVYKHNSSLSKKQGELVLAGEVIASAGNTGEYSTGWHLHFELWIEGYPMDPLKVLNFE